MATNVSISNCIIEACQKAIGYVYIGDHSPSVVSPVS